MNKNISFPSLFLLGLLIFGLMLVIPQQSVYASCGVNPNTKQPLPCPNDPSKSDYSKKNQATTVPTNTPIPTPTDTPKAGVVVDQANNPNASCPPAPLAVNNTTPPTPANSSFFDIPPLLLGGGGTLLGILIGLLLGGVFFRNRVNGDGNRGLNGPITAPGELLPAIQKAYKFDKWQKADKFDKPMDGQGNLLPAIDKDQKGDAVLASGGDRSVNGDGMPAGFDVFHKGQDAGFADGSVHTAMGDGSVHPSNKEAAGFLKRDGAGITDGTSLSGNSSAPSVSENPQQTTQMDDWEHLNGDG